MATDSVMAKWDDSEVEEIAKWAVDEYNKEHGTHFVFVRLLAAHKSQVGDIVLYNLLIEVKDDDGRHYRIEVLVVVKPYGRKELWGGFVEFDQEIIGGWIDAGNDVGIEDLAKWAVDEYNKKEGTTLEFIKLKNAQKQLVNGILYKLTLDDGHNKLYQAMVLVVPWEKIKKLEDFKPLLLNVED